MSTVNVLIPTVLDGGAERRSFRKEIQTILAANNDVLFVDRAGNEATPQYINVSADCLVRCRSKDALDATKHDENYAGKGWHPFGQSMIYATGTTGSVVITVRTDD